MVRLFALLAGLAIVMSAPAAEECASCTPGTVFTSNELKPTLVTATGGEGVIWAAAVDTRTSVSQILRIDPVSGDYRIVAQFFESAATIRDLESDSEALYVLISEQPGASAILRVDKSGGRIQTLVSSTSADDIQVDESRLYWAANDRLHRVPKNGGDQETLYASHGSAFPEIREFVVDDNEVFVAERAGGGYVVNAIRKTDGARRFVASFPFVSALAVDELAVYAGVSNSIERVAKSGGGVEEIARLHPFVELAMPTVGDFVVKDGRAIVRQTNAMLRGRVSANLVVYAPGGRVRSLSRFDGDFAVTSCSVFHIPTVCCDVPPQPPFTVERHCLADTEPRRRVVRR